MTALKSELTLTSYRQCQWRRRIARNGANRSINTRFVLGSRAPAQVTAAGLLMLMGQETARTMRNLL